MTRVFRDGLVHVRAEQCDHCLFSRDRLVDGARAREIVAATRAEDGASFICHRNQVSDDPEAICKAWFDLYATDDPVFRLAVALDKIKEV